MQQFFPVVLLVLLAASRSAQSIKGRTIDAQTVTPLAYATISLFSKIDSQLIDGSITDDAVFFP